MSEVKHENSNITIQEVKDVLELFGKLSEKNKDIALAALKGMTLVTESNQNGA